MNEAILISSGQDVDFMIHGVKSFTFRGQTLWITTTHVALLIVLIILCGFAFVVNHKLKKAKPEEKPTGLLNIAELIVETLDKMVKSSMDKFSTTFRNYIGTLFIFLLFSNISGVFGLRPPTADFGVTFPLALITFTLIHFNEFKYQKPKGVLKNLCNPWPIWLPINLVSDLAVPISLSLRLFANILSGVAIMSLIYTLLATFAWVWPGVLHVYFDLFAGAIQTYVFCMLTMTYIRNAIGEQE